MQPLNKTIREIRERRGMKQVELANKIGISIGHMSKIEADDKMASKISLRLVRNIAEAFGMDDISLLARSLTRTKPDPESSKFIDVVGVANGKASAKPTRSRTGAPNDINDPDIYAVELGDDSMAPYPKEAIVIATPSLKVETGNLVVTKIEGTYLCRVYHKSVDSIVLSTLNPSCQPVTLTKSHYANLHRVFELKFPK